MSGAVLNLITGFLGAGKTTAILHLLAHRPAHERWAVLVNEFGEVGIDGEILADAAGDEIRVREVSGGCICCTGAMNLRVALTKILREIRPDRLLVEPTGLGHPTGIVDTLRDPWLASAARLGNITCIVDPAGFSQERLEKSLIYKDQLTLADVVVINKTDVAPADQLAALEAFVAGLYPPKQAVVRTTHGRIDPALLDLEASGVDRAGERRVLTVMAPAGASVVGSGPGSVAAPLSGASPDTQAPAADTARGWRFAPEDRFDLKVLEGLFSKPPFSELVRAKGVVRTGREWYRFDWAEGRFSTALIAWRRDSRVELIADEVLDWMAVEKALTQALTPCKAATPSPARRVPTTPGA
ncbi:MAG: GTP-binding protein [Chromatiaceae bacterium]|nr:MAG: GTP-binding protein [Chromatiaceae bacterium]